MLGKYFLRQKVFPDNALLLKVVSSPSLQVHQQRYFRRDRSIR